MNPKTYRFVGHSRADPAKYRRAGELEIWQARDPLKLLAAAIHPAAPDQLIASLRDRWETVMADVVDTVLAAPEPEERDMFRHVYAPGSTQG
jgi:TPP-dependent pyruvate/acetoin dehydrogenase alpha subunit